MTDATPQRLSLPRVLAFSSLSIPLAGVGLPLSVYLAPLYAENVGLGLELTGFLFMMLRFWDILTDPVMGYLVDRYRSPWGRVRHWVVIGAPILGIATYFVYMPGEGAGPIYFVGWMFLFYVGFTLLQTSRSAWVPGIAHAYDERSRFFQWIEIIQIITMLLLLTVPAMQAALGMQVDRFGQVAAMGWILLISLPIVVFLSCKFVPDPDIPGDTRGAQKFEWSAILAALRNRFLVRALTLEFLVGTAIAITAANYLFLAEYVFGLVDWQSSIVLMIFFVTAVIAIPFWLRLAAQTEKHIALRYAAMVSMFSYVLYFFVGQVGGFVPLIIGAIINGSAFSAPTVLVRSMIADVIEEQAARTGENRAGIYYSLMTVAYKVGFSIALGVGYLVIGQVAGFHPGKENSPASIQGLLIVFCLLPGTLYLLTTISAATYPLTREVQRQASEKIAGQAVAGETD